MKILDGRELAGFVKERQANLVRQLRVEKVFPKLLIIRDSDNPVITKYVHLKQRYGEDIGVEVEDFFAKNSDEIRKKILAANSDPTISGIIVQLPILEKDCTDELTSLIVPEKDVDGLGMGADPSQSETLKRPFYSATATAITWLLTGYDIDLPGKKIALVGYGKLVGRPLEKIWRSSGLDVTVFRSHSDLSKLIDFDIIVSATGVPHLIKNSMIKPGTVIIDAGTASEDGVLVGDLDNEVRTRTDLSAITPSIGGVGPLTVSVLFDNVIAAASR